MASLPALTVAAGLMLRITESLKAGQGPAGSLVVIVRVTVPAATSDAEGVYTGLTIVALLKVPVPDVVHVEAVALPPRIPAN